MIPPGAARLHIMTPIPPRCVTQALGFTDGWYKMYPAEVYVGWFDANSGGPALWRAQNVANDVPVSKPPLFYPSYAPTSPQRATSVGGGRDARAHFCPTRVRVRRFPQPTAQAPGCFCPETSSTPPRGSAQ